MLCVGYIFMGSIIDAQHFCRHMKMTQTLCQLTTLLKFVLKNHDIKFVLGHRVKAKITMLGIDLLQISQAGLIDVLLLHSFVAKTQEGVVYIFPQHINEYIAEGFTPWKRANEINRQF
jgi:hypothetical protein